MILIYDILQDIRFALRTMARSPGFTVVALATLALGIGANAAMFGSVYPVLLKPLPFRDPSRLVAAWDTYVPAYPKLGVSPVEIAEWSAQTELFEKTLWYRYVSYDATLASPGSDAIEIHATFVSPSFFPTLGVVPAIGSTGGVVISDSLWRTRFGADRAVIGKSIRLSDQAFTISGVMPASFRFPDWADAWLPPGPLLGDEATNPVRHALGFVARLRGGATETAAAARLKEISQRLAAEHPKTSAGWGIRVAALQDDITASVRPALLLLAGAVGLVLLIACANIANLLLARAQVRTREIAIRSSLGAGAWRIARQMLTESVVLSLIGGALGIALVEAAPWRVGVDLPVLIFALAISILTGILFGLAPALTALRRDTSRAIKAGAGPRTLIAVEFGLALMLVSGAALLVESFAKLMHVNPGFDPRGVLALRINVPASRDAAQLFRRIEENARAIPGVEAVASMNELPLAANRASTSRFNVPGSPLINPDALPAARIRVVSPEYFRVMRIPVVAGRAFDARDLNQPVAIINETMARRFWPGKNPVGEKYVTGVWGAKPQSSTIIGVAGDVKQFGLDSEPGFDEYFPLLGAKYIALRTAGDASALAGDARRMISAIDPGLPVSDVRTMEQIEAESASSRRSTMQLLSAFAVLALMLAMVGVYGVIAWSVERRTREIGIRLALGAEPRRVMRGVLADGLRLSAIGSAMGIAGAYAARRLLASLVFEVSTSNVWIYAAAMLVMSMVAIAACYLPARRAARVDPAVALRTD